MFLSGCNLRCGFCHNTELVLEPNKLDTISLDEFYDFLNRRKGKLEGVVVCGGEPCFSSGLIDFISVIKSKGYFVKLDTNGCFPDVLENLIINELIDYIALDVKYPFSRYGKDSANIEKSIKLLIDSGIEHEIRTTIVPGMLSKNDLIEISSGIQGVRRWYLQQFRNQKCLNKDFEKIVPYSYEKLEEFARVCGKRIKTFVRG